MAKDELEKSSREAPDFTEPKAESDPETKPDEKDKPGLPVAQRSSGGSNPDEIVKPGMSVGG